MEREKRGREDYSKFQFPEEFFEEEGKGKNPEIAEIDQEITLEELEIRPEDIKGIEAQMESEKKKEGTEGKQSLAFEASALARLRKEAPEAGIEKVELSEGDIKNCKERMEKDIEDAVKAKTKKVEEDWMKEKRKVGRIQTDENTPEEQFQLSERIKNEIKSEQAWIREFQSSYLKDILNEKEFKESSFEIGEKEWKEMVKDLGDLIGKKDWHKVIPRMGHMNNLDPEKFGDISRSLFDSSDKEGMLEHIEELKGDEAAGKKVNAWELASRIRYVAECFPELRSRIKLDDKNWEKMNDLLDNARKKGDYWKFSYQGCNMKIIENMVKLGEIKAVKGKIEKKDSAAE
ncbi:MAG: hypothetical protein Q8N37_03390 [bacterium]|nr:hypothetical protein [bacterium]